MNVEIGTEAAQFPEKEYLNGISFAVCRPKKSLKNDHYRACVFLLTEATGWGDVTL